MDENSSVLSQDAIDALLNSQLTDDSDPESAVEPSPGAGEEPVASGEQDGELAPAAEIPAENSRSDDEAGADEQADDSAEEPPGVLEAEPADEDEQAGELPEEPPGSAIPLESTVPARPVPVNVPPPPGVTPPPGVVPSDAGDAAAAGVDEEEARRIAADEAESAAESVRGDVSSLSGRVVSLEAAVARIKVLEKQVADLRRSGESEALDLEALKPLIEKVKSLEAAGRNSPLHNLYEKFTCKACSTRGAAQARIRTGHCGKEGWFGRRQPGD